MSLTIFGLPINGFGLSEVLAQGGWIVTANPEIMVYANRHDEYKKLLLQADLRIVDGRGLEFGCLMKGYEVKRVTGVQLANALMQKAAKDSLRVALIGGKNPLTAEKAKLKLQQQYPMLLVESWHGGTISRTGEMDEVAQKHFRELAEYRPHIVLVAFGHPRQEYLIAQHRHEWTEAKYMVGVGGVFEFWTGEQKRAPKWMQEYGLEWLFRWYQEPSRWKRMFTALVVFPAEVFLEKFGGEPSV